MRYMIICLVEGPNCAVPNELHDHMIGPGGISKVVLEHLGGHSGLGFLGSWKTHSLGEALGS